MLNISDKTKKYLEILEQEFNRENFCDFIKDLLNLNSEDIVNGKEQNAGTELYRNYIDKSQLYAKYKDDKKRTIGIIIIKLKNNKNPANARTLQRNFIAHLLNYYELDASITAIYSDTDDTWRLSFVKQELEIEVGKLKTKVSPAKRYSYLFGKDEPNHTAKEQLLELLENNIKKYSVEEIEEKFSVEKVTKDFFEKYKENYLKLKETLEKNDEFISESKRCDFTAEEFTKKLMGQIVFIYFLQKKGWLGVKLVPSKLSINEFDEIYNKQDILGKKILDTYYISYNGGKIVKKELLEKLKENEQELETLSDIFVDTKYDKEWGTGEKRFIRAIFENCKNRNKNFFDDYLEPFFYNGLNHKRKNQYFSVFNCKIPFLNGGLFEPLDNYKWEIAKFNIDNDIFSNKNEDGILDFFDRYNFTMNEEEPLEKDVAVDPEMLGKIFENLLDVKDRKSKGAFYTPREIVHYMCQESLANYLVNKVGVDYKEIKEFIQYGEMIRDVDLKEATKDDYLVGRTIFENIGKVDKALAKIKIADPAVGSGAFPLGMLNEIVKLRDILTSYLLIYNRLNLLDKKYTECLITNTRSIYKIKWNTIRNSIYAVDIENSAVDITKLRLWLSIVVDQVEVPKSGPEPLPNLDCKIMQGNSLVDEYAGIKLIDERFIDELKDRENVKFNESKGIVKDFKGHKQYISNNQIQFGDGQKKVQIDDLINLKKELYGTNEPNRKKELLYKIYVARKELLRLNFVGTNREEELFEIDKTHNKPYFAWMLEFIEVFIENNGFDIVIGNPPYVGEKGNKETFRDIKVTEFGAKYYQRKMDLFYFFFHKGIDISNNNSIILFITTNYYPTATGAKKLRKDLKERTSIIRLINFNELKIFESAMGQHNLITILEKPNNTKKCIVTDCKEKGFANGNELNRILNSDDKNNTILAQDELFELNDMMYIRLSGNKNEITENTMDSILDKIQKNNPLLSELCNINQGLRTGADKVKNSHIMKYHLEKDGIEKDEGIFILPNEQVNFLHLTEREKKKIKPLFKNSDIKKYYSEEESKYSLIDIFYPNDRDINMEEYPNLFKHLQKYKKILEGRSENANGIDKAIARGEYWYASVRRKINFDIEKIICPQRNRYNVFGYNSIPWYASADVYFITQKEKNINLKYLLGLLNSKLYYIWLYHRGKRKGDTLELYEQPLSEIPIKLTDKEVEESIIKIVDKIISLKKINIDTSSLENELDLFIYNIYGLTKEEINIVENFYLEGC